DVYKRQLQNTPSCVLTLNKNLDSADIVVFLSMYNFQYTAQFIIVLKKIQILFVVITTSQNTIIFSAFKSFCNTTERFA
ncbi:hypothetical protein C7B79_34965, partial [Chroococcidiopsis cubana CCALA 043]